MPAPPSPRAIAAEFATPDGVQRAVDELRLAGCPAETFAPYELPHDERAPRSRSLLPALVLGAGIAGAAGSYWIQWYASVVEYPQNAGGRPLHAAPSFIYSTFEGMVLLAALAAFVGLLLILRLPRLSHPLFAIPGFQRASVDRFWVAVDVSRSPISPARCTRLLERAGAIRIVHPEAEVT